MQFGKIQGTVVASRKTPTMEGLTLKVLQPCNSDGATFGDAIVAIDPVGAREGDLVMWVGKREASLAVPGAAMANLFPVDAAVTGIIDAVG